MNVACVLALQIWLTVTDPPHTAACYHHSSVSDQMVLVGGNLPASLAETPGELTLNRVGCGCRVSK